MLGFILCSGGSWDFANEGGGIWIWFILIPFLFWYFASTKTKVGQFFFRTPSVWVSV